MTREKGPACEGAKKETLGECINRLRRESGQTLRGLAKEVGVSPAFLSDLEKGRHQDRCLGEQVRRGRRHCDGGHRRGRFYARAIGASNG